MTLPVRPNRGGFLRSFGCGFFIRDFLLGKGPEYGATAIDPDKGACQEDIFYHYKLAIHKAYAEDATAWENDQRIKARLEPYTELEYAERVDWHLRRIPYKLVKCRYHSFQRYFHWLKQPGWVEVTNWNKSRAVGAALRGVPNAGCAHSTTTGTNSWQPWQRRGQEQNESVS
jgi:hypothetical protein